MFLRLVADRGIEGTSVLDVTEELGVSNGSFYYYFQDKDELLEVVGHAVVARLVTEIEGVDQPDPAARVARGPLVILKYVDRHPELSAIMLRVIDDPEGLHEELADRLRRNVAQGIKSGRFSVEDPDIAVRFCRSVVGTAVRLKHQGRRNKNIARNTAIHTLTMLGIPPKEAKSMVEQQQRLLLH